MLKNWSDRGKGEDLAAISGRLVRDLSTVQEAHTRVLVPPPIQGLGASNGFQMQVELTDGSYDFERLQRITDRIVHEANAAPEVRDAFTSFRASVPQVTVQVDKTHAANLGVNLGDVYNTVQAYLGSTFVNLFTRFGHNYMVYLQADPLRRVSVSDVKDLYVRNSAGAMVPVGAVADIHPTVGTSVISLYNLFPAATINGMPARRLQLRPGAHGDGDDRAPGAPARDGLRVDGDVLPGAARRQLVLLHLRAVAAPRVLRARRTVRELDHAGGGDSGGADGARSARRPRCAWPASITTSTCRSGSCS